MTSTFAERCYERELEAGGGASHPARGVHSGALPQEDWSDTLPRAAQQAAEGAKGGGGHPAQGHVAAGGFCGLKGRQAP